MWLWLRTFFFSRALTSVTFGTDMISSLSLLRICQLELERAIQSPVVVKLGCVKAGASGLVRWYNKNTKFTHLPSLSSSHLNSSMKRVFIENSYFSRRTGHSCLNSSWKGDIKIHKNKKKNVGYNKCRWCCSDKCYTNPEKKPLEAGLKGLRKYSLALEDV